MHDFIHQYCFKKKERKRTLLCKIRLNLSPVTLHQSIVRNSNMFCSRTLDKVDSNLGPQ